MPGDASPANVLVIERPSDSDLTVSLHPLILLTISDHLTRHQVRGHSGVIVGALLGQQKGREITLEHAFECNVQIDDQHQVTLQTEWFEDRLQQYKDVHKAPPLDLVGWYTSSPESGPNSAFLPIHKQFIAQNESALLLAFHPSALVADDTGNSSGKLPLTIYETSHESEPAQQDEIMQIDGEEASGLKFRPVPYAFETSETEMIAVDYVAKGGGNAAVISGDQAGSSRPTQENEVVGKKGKARADEAPESMGQSNGTTMTPAVTPTNLLTSEEEDQIASMTTRLNSVQMLQARLSLLSTYVTSLAPSSSNLAAGTTTKPDPPAIDQVHLPHLRHIKALIGRLSLLTPHPATSSNSSVTSPTTATTTMPTMPNHPEDQVDPLTHSQQSQANDSSLSTLLSVLGQDIHSLSEVGRKFAIVEAARNTKGKKPMNMGAGASGSGNGGGGGIGSVMAGMGYAVARFREKEGERWGGAMDDSVMI